MSSAREATRRWSGSVNVWNADYVEELYQRWLEEPEAVPHSWHVFFDGFTLGYDLESEEDFETQSSRLASVATASMSESSQIHASQTGISRADASLLHRVRDLIYAYRRHGHLAARVNPLEQRSAEIEELSIASFGLSENDLDLEFSAAELGFLAEREGATTERSFSLRSLIKVLKQIYCEGVGVEMMHIQDQTRRNWMMKYIETRPERFQPSSETQKHILKSLSDAELLETFTHKRYLGQKRFSLEGGESLIAALRHMVELCPEEGIEEIVLGMAHRGRLNVLANIMGMSYASIFSEFEGAETEVSYGDGDVKYHKGFSRDYKTRSGELVHLSLASNPSHLEAVNPVVEGLVRAKQRQRGDTEHRRKVVPLLLHGDAAFAGQGLVAETLNLSQLPGYRTGGTIHVIINNQIGFTTTPEEARSSEYATDVAKMIEAPILHVNGEDPEAVLFAVEVAMRFRQTFGHDIVIDMLCYRRHGHNEGDEPAFTQPLMYKDIRKRASVRKLYEERLLESGALSKEEAESLTAAFETELQEALDYVREEKPKIGVQAFNQRWKGLDKPFSHSPAPTEVSVDLLKEVARATCTVPEGFSINRKIGRHLPKRLKAVEEGGTIDWAFAESLAFGTLLCEGIPVRLSGQDSARGTFSQRHAVWRDMETQETHTPVNHIRDEQASFCVYNSLLSEAAVLGFDFGYALAEPYMLNLWEAQFGDFANGAQVLIDQFITGSESKWQRTNGIVMLLPHGYEGQGPEHSNAYLERYLIACAEDNIQVCNITTPAQYFHALRRQVKRPFRRPLVIMTPKSLLRHSKAVSPISDLTDKSFQEILDDPMQPIKAKRIALCSGKVYYDLEAYRQQLPEAQQGDVALIRVEQFYPFNDALFAEIVARYPDHKEVFWVQEESQNRGGWTFMFPHLLERFIAKPVVYVGRDASASPATASAKKHKEEQQNLVEATFNAKLSPEQARKPFVSLTF